MDRKVTPSLPSVGIAEGSSQFGRWSVLSDVAHAVTTIVCLYRSKEQGRLGGGHKVTYVHLYIGLGEHTYSQHACIRRVRTHTQGAQTHHMRTCKCTPHRHTHTHTHTTHTHNSLGSEKQCPGPPQWREISLSHAQYPLASSSSFGSSRPFGRSGVQSPQRHAGQS